ncbi:MAG: AAA family ATPase, partial [Clostridia bacterium]|nr:AAA family ATPase [Clostridia bacterium]
MLESVKTLHEAVRAHVGRVIVGKTEVVDLVFISMLCGGHILIDDVPGTGKTVLAKTFAEALDLDFKRVQCVPDMLPSDLVGVNFFDMKTSEFRFLKGPVFTNVLLADEINRAMPKTQSGLLECMEERQVTVEGKTYPLDEIFTVIATQNPIETKGTFDLPEAQLDRFLVKTSMGYPSASESVEILRRKLKNETAVSPSTRIPRERLTEAREAMNEVYVHEDLLAYASALCEATRQGKDVLLGASPRAMIALVRVAQ